MNVTGVILPRTGEFYALEFSHSDTEIFQIFLEHASPDISFERPRNLLILDNASWHKSKSLDWGRFEPLFLPSYSPDLNPIERLWLIMKVEWFSGFYAKTKDQLIDRLTQALRWLIDRKDDNSKNCVIPTNFREWLYHQQSTRVVIPALARMTRNHIPNRTSILATAGAPGEA